MNTNSSSGLLKYDFSELGITISKIERLMGYDHGSAPEPIGDTIQSVFDEATEITDIQGGYELIPQFKAEDDSIIIENITFLTGKIVTHFIKPSTSLAFFIFTAGKEIQVRSRKCFAGNDPMKGYVYDVMGSEIAESAVDKMQNDLEQRMLKEGIKITNRYSPGYCGWPINDQFKLFSFFPENYGGITLSKTALMDPIKSVSGVIGIGPKVRQHPYSCQLCDAQNCIYRDKR
jgi:hypothetical protein